MTRQTQQQRKAATRGKLLSAARVAFARQGLGSVSIDGLSEAAGFSRGAFYAHYANKQELVLELLAELHELEIRAWQQLVVEADNAENMFAAMEVRFNEFALSKDWWLLHGELQLHAQRDAQFGEKFRYYSEETMRLLEDMLSAVAAKIPGGMLPDKRLAALGLRGLALGIMFEGPNFTDPGKVLVLVIRALITKHHPNMGTGE